MLAVACAAAGHHSLLQLVGLVTYGELPSSLTVPVY